MRKKSRSKALSLSMFGPPPLLEGEDAAAYDELLARVSAAANPSDVIHEIWVRDVVDLTWEILRWRRLKKKDLEVLSVTSVTLSNYYMDLLEKIVVLDRLTTIAETRRNNALREIERHRTALAQTLRNKNRDVEDTELKAIEPKLIARVVQPSTMQHDQRPKN